MGRDFVWHGPAVERMIEANVEQRLDAAADVVINKVQKSFTGPKHGKFYKGQRTRSSKAGEAPAVQSSGLADRVAQEKSAPLERKVGILVKSEEGAYGLHLEMGTSKMDAHPWLLPALLKSKKPIRKIFS